MYFPIYISPGIVPYMTSNNNVVLLIHGGIPKNALARTTINRVKIVHDDSRDKKELRSDKEAT